MVYSQEYVVLRTRRTIGYRGQGHSRFEISRPINPGDADMLELRNPHDTFFKENFSHKHTAVEFLVHYLPAEVLLFLDMDSIEISKDTFVDEDLRESYSDILYEIQMAGSAGYVYILFEHKSFADRFTAFQLLKYMVRIWEQHLKQSIPSDLPVILPLVIYHGTGKWKFGNRLRNLFDPKQDALYFYVPDYEYLLCDLSHMSDEQIRGSVITRVMLLAMKHIFSDQLGEKLFSILNLLNTIADQERGLQCLHVLFRYIVEATDKLSKEDFNSVLSRVKKGEDIMPTLAQQWFEEGRQEGKQEGKQEGLKEGEERGERRGRLSEACEVIVELIETQFGVPPQGLVEKLNRIGSYEVMRLLRRQLRSCRTISEFEQLVEKAL